MTIYNYYRLQQDVDGLTTSGIEVITMVTTVSGDIVEQIPSLDGYATEVWVNNLVTTVSGNLRSSMFSGFYKITVGTSQPSNPSTGDLWVDTN